MTNRLRKSMRAGDSLDWRPQAFLLAALAIMFLPWLGDIIFNSKGEPREAIVAVSILDSGNWVLPTSFGADIPYKPPFLAWLIAAFATVFNGGVVTEYISRLPSALALMGLCWATYRWAAHSRGARFGLLTAMMLATCFEVFRAGIACRVDMLLTACAVVPIFILDRARRHPAAWRYIAAAELRHPYQRPRGLAAALPRAGHLLSPGRRALLAHAWQAVGRVHRVVHPARAVVLRRVEAGRTVLPRPRL